eukprot:gene8717-8898_t
MDRQQLQQGMKRGHIFRAKIRMNAANRSEAFCTLEGLPSDVLLRGDINHNRAFEGDEVAVQVFKLQDWFTVYKESSKLAELGLLPAADTDPIALSQQLAQMALSNNDPDGLLAAQAPWTTANTSAAALTVIGDLLRARPDMRATGKVVSILEPSPRREAVVGVLLTPAAAMSARPGAAAGSTLSPAAAYASAALSAGAYNNQLMLVPLDPRLPKCLVTPSSMAGVSQALCDEASAVGLTSRTFVACRVVDWPSGSPFPHVEVRQSLGPTGDIDAGTTALLAAEGVKDEDFSLEVYACLPKVPWSISEADLKARADFTSWRVFSIDPITARDLDDALSIQALPGRRWRMGVHIADVASFVRPGTALDEEAQVRGTSVYLVQRVIPMLPRLLCEQLCSLQPGDPRCAFSIVWEMDEDGHIYREWAGRSVINSCAKLAYPMVQQMIQGCFDPASWQIQLFHGATWDDVVFDCLALHGIASRLRAARFASGALRLTNTRLSFALDTGGNPVSTSPYVQAEANWLVEEFMLLANMRVAGIIARAFPQHAMLRRHPPPNERKMEELKAAAELLGKTLDASTAAALQASLAALKQACPDKATAEVVMLLATKPMQLAQYFCTGEAPDPKAWRHYALAVDLYTHFTSPIRRYPDVIVHRLLAAALELAQHLQQPDNAELLTALVEQHAELPAPAPSVTDSMAGMPAQVAAVKVAAIQHNEDIAPAAAGQAVAAAGELQAAAGAGREAPKDDEAAAGAEAATTAAADLILAKHMLPDTATLAKIAKHSNETKLAARLVSDGSLRLFLCIMLKKQPVVTWGLVNLVGGDRFFSVYLPEFGCETRMYLNLMGLPLAGSWDDKTQELTITSADEHQLADAASSGSRSTTQATGSAGESGKQSRAPSCQLAAEEEVTGEQQQELLLNSPSFDLRAWLVGLENGVLNIEHIPCAQLPLKTECLAAAVAAPLDMLQLAMFVRVPVVVSTYINRVPRVMSTAADEPPVYLNAGQYIGHRLLQLGCTHIFNVPGDFNLPVLDAMATVSGLHLVSTSNELNAAYAADGYARATGSLGCSVTTFLVGALSAINGVAGSFAEELPVLCVVGVPATRQYAGLCTLHHTLGNAENMSQEVDCYKPVTCYQTILRTYQDARYLIDKAFTRALQHRKPVLLEICRDIAMLPHPCFGRAPPAMTPFPVPRAISDPSEDLAAVAAVTAFFAERKLPIIVVGRRVRTMKNALLKLADATGWGVIVLHDGKGMFPEEHPSFIGCLFPGFTSLTSITKAYEAADSILFVGTHFNEFSFGSPPTDALKQRSVITYKDRVLVGQTDAFNQVSTEALLLALASKLKHNSAMVDLFKALPQIPTHFPTSPEFTAPEDAPLKLAFVYDLVGKQLLDGEQPMSVMVDTGDSMLRTHSMKLPGKTPYELQLFAGNIGWACPAGLGFSLATEGQRRLVVLGGDGGLQMTAAEIGNYVKCGSNAIWVCVNNDGYLIERYLSPIPEAGYNYPKRWDYSLLAEAMCNKEGKYKVYKVRTETEAVAAIAEAKELPDHFIFIEVIVDKRDAAPCAGAMREAFLNHHFDMQSYHKVTHSTQQANSGLTSGLAVSGARPEGQAEAASGMRPQNLGSSSCLPAMAAAAQAGGSKSDDAPLDDASIAQGEPEYAEHINGKDDGMAKTVTSVLPCKRAADGTAKDALE